MTKPLDPIEPLTATLPAAIPEAHAQCQNCDAALQGGYCHVCGQHAHNPLKSFRHAVEDVFESFWHLDGRIFRTLRDLLVPGRVSRGFLDGHRVRYIPPLRLYVILSLLTFFVAHFVAAGIEGRFTLDDDNDGVVQATTVAAVERERAAALLEIDQGLKEAGSGTATRVALNSARRAVNAAADRRLAVLNGKATAEQAAEAAANGSVWRVKLDGAKPDPSTRWGRMRQQWEKNAEANMGEFSRDGRLFVERLIKHVPSTLFVLVPLFALVLRLVYLLRPMGYLEHLVVALYSHSFLLLAALVWMLMLLLDRALGTSMFGIAAAIVLPLVVLAYLLFSQKRVYGNGWPATLLAWLVTGFAYFVLATFAISFAMIMSLLLKG